VVSVAVMGLTKNTAEQKIAEAAGVRLR
jgi:hypothetical protein